MTVNITKLMSVRDFLGMEGNNSTYYYDLEEKNRALMIANIQDWILTSQSLFYKKMHNIVVRNVKKYRADFYIHDVTHFFNTNSRNFLWFVRENGTHLVDLENEHLLDGEKWQGEYNAKLYAKSSDRIYSIKGTQVIKINEEKMLEILKKFNPSI